MIPSSTSLTLFDSDTFFSSPPTVALAVAVAAALAVVVALSFLDVIP